MKNRIPLEIQQKVFTVRGMETVLDKDLAELFKVAKKVLVRALEKNKMRFPPDFVFRLTSEECKSLHLSNDGLDLPYAFTELGVVAMSSVLNSMPAILMNISIMRSPGLSIFEIIKIISCKK